MINKRIVHLVDDDASIVTSTAAFLSIKGFGVARYGSALEFLKVASPAMTGCVVTDVRMTGMTGIELVECLRARRISIPIIIITAHADMALAIRAMRHGVLDLLEKPFSNDALVKSIQDTCCRWTERQVGSNSADISGRLRALTTREKDVLLRLLNGMPNKIIAHELGVSTRTVETHRATIMSKMNASSLADLVRMSLSTQEFGSRVVGENHEI
jgi:two-component system, LuxR family, response regulator FixJ